MRRRHIACVSIHLSLPINDLLSFRCLFSKVYTSHNVYVHTSRVTCHVWLRTSRICSYQDRKDEEDYKTMEITRQYDVMYATEQTQQLWLGVSQAIHCSTPRQLYCRRKTTQKALHVCTSSTSEDESMYKLNLEPNREHTTLYSKAPRIGSTTLSSTEHSGKFR